MAEEKKRKPGRPRKNQEDMDDRTKKETKHKKPGRPPKVTLTGERREDESRRAFIDRRRREDEEVNIEAVKRLEEKFAGKKSMCLRKLPDGLTVMERIFVTEYCKDPTQNKYELIRKCGTKATTEASVYSRYVQIMNRPHVQAAIEEQLVQWQDLLQDEAINFVKMTLDLYKADYSGSYRIKGGKVQLLDTEKQTAIGRKMLKSVSVTPGEYGEAVSASTIDTLPYYKMVGTWLGLLGNTRGAINPPDYHQLEAIRAVRNGEKTVVEAALELEAVGVPLPETFKIMLAKTDLTINAAAETQTVVVSPEEMWARRQARLKETENEVEEFLPARQEEVRQLKESLGSSNKAFSPDMTDKSE